MNASSLSRRTFLKKTAVAAGSAGLLASTHFAFPGAASHRPILGIGDHTYEMDHAWAKLPAGKQFGYTHAVVEDSRGRIYVANQSRDAIMVFEPDGTFLHSWGQAYAPGAHGLRLSREGDDEFLYLANTGLGEVVKTTLDGDVVWKAGRPYLPEVYTQDKPYSPTETVVGPNGSLYVADGYGQSWIHIYTLEGEYVRSFGGRGDDVANLNVPHGINIDDRGGEPILQISDRSNIRIANFSLDGDFIGVAIPPDDLRYPCTTIPRDGLLYIPDLYARVSIFDEHNKKVIDLGDYVDGKPIKSREDLLADPDLEGYPNIPHEKRRQGKFSSPHGLWVDSAGNIYVAEWINDGRVTKLTKV